MQSHFVQQYAALKKAQADKKLSGLGLWLAYGDEPLLLQWLLDVLKLYWQQQGLTIKRFELTSVTVWQEVLSELNSLSLFDDGVAVVLTGTHKPDKAIIAKLHQFAQEVHQQNNHNCLFWMMLKKDKRSVNGKWLVPFQQDGYVIDCHIHQEQQRKEILKMKADEFGLRLSEEAWQLMMMQTQHHLLSAYQSLWRLSYLLPSLDNNAHIEQIDVTQLESVLENESQFTVFNLSDAMLAGDVQQVVKILEYFKATNEPESLILWAIEKDMQIILQMLSGKTLQELGVWKNKASLYHQAYQRQTLVSTKGWADLLFQCDAAIKGVIQQPAWELLLQAALLVAGKPLFASYPR